MIDNYKITEFLTNKELFGYLAVANSVGNHEFILKYKQNLGDFAIFIADQNTLRAKAKTKLPKFVAHGCFFTSRSLEQCTDEAVAKYKASIIKGNNLLSLATGLGADDVAFSDAFKTIISVDNDITLNTIAIHNFKLLGIHNITRITANAEDYIQKNKVQFDAIYLDPDRRNGNIRQILLSHHQPNVIQLMPELIKIARAIYIKCSPLYDIDMAFKEVEYIAEIYCISLKGEVKEMLLKIVKDSEQSLRLTCVDITPQKTIEVTFTTPSQIPIEADTLTGFFYEAGSSLVKVRKHHTYAAIQQLSMIDASVPFYIGSKAIPDFLGKCLQIIQCFPFNIKQIKLYLRTQAIHQINIKIRGLKNDSSTLFNQLEIKEGGNDFLFICPFKGKQVVIHCRPLNNFGSIINNEI